MAVTIEGSSKAIISVDDVYGEGSTFSTRKIFSFFIEYIREGSNVIRITVKGADADEYITLYVHLVDNTSSYKGLGPEKYLVPNKPVVTSYLEREVLNEEMFPT